MERVPSRPQFTRSPFGAVSIISGATAKEIRVSRVNRSRVLSSNSIVNTVNSLSSIKRTCLIVFPRSEGYSIPLYLYIGSFRFLRRPTQFECAAPHRVLQSENTNDYIGNLGARNILSDFLDLALTHRTGRRENKNCLL